MFLFHACHRTLSDLFDIWLESLKMFRTIYIEMYVKMGIIIIVNVLKLGKCPELLGGQQKH